MLYKANKSYIKDKALLFFICLNDSFEQGLEVHFQKDPLNWFQTHDPRIASQGTSH